MEQQRLVPQTELDYGDARDSITDRIDLNLQ